MSTYQRAQFANPLRDSSLDQSVDGSFPSCRTIVISVPTLNLEIDIHAIAQRPLAKVIEPAVESAAAGDTKIASREAETADEVNE